MYALKKFNFQFFIILTINTDSKELKHHTKLKYPRAASLNPSKLYSTKLTGRPFYSRMDNSR